MDYKLIRLDHRVILDMIMPNVSVLDLGCGNGDLLSLLIKEKKVSGQGIEIDDNAIYECIAKGLNVLHGDIDSGLAEYSDKSFDYVILNQSLQQISHIEVVLKDALRVGKKVIIGFPNFAYYRGRMQIFFRGKTPVMPSLPYKWFDTPNLHFLSILDFAEYCYTRNIRIERAVFINKKRKIRIFHNLIALTGIFLVSNEGIN
ncbi:MAG: methionine biosynthesis protein MetW [Candidatus Firestonebacteria bacterium]